MPLLPDLPWRPDRPPVWRPPVDDGWDPPVLVTVALDHGYDDEADDRERLPRGA